MRQFEKALMLNVLDQHWKNHLACMDYLRQGIGLRGYAQKQPMQEYKRESYEMFTELLHNIKQEVIRILARVQVKAEEDVEAVDARRRPGSQMDFRMIRPAWPGWQVRMQLLHTAVNLLSAKDAKSAGTRRAPVAQATNTSTATVN